MGHCHHGGPHIYMLQKLDTYHVVVWGQADTGPHDVLQHGTLLGQRIHHWRAVRDQGSLDTNTRMQTWPTMSEVFNTPPHHL